VSGVDIEEARRLRERYEAVLDDAEAARAAYHDALKELHRSEMSLRDIAEQLGMSHQRVHQIVGARAYRSRP
jgi:HD superfamily phosphohydrolase YqeK